MEEYLTVQTPLEDIQKPSRRKFTINKIVIGGVLIVAAVVLLAITSLRGNAQYYLTVDELLSGKVDQTQAVRISGVVLGDSIQYDTSAGILTFEVANIPGDNATIEKMGGLAAALHASAIDPSGGHLKVVYHGTKPDLLTNEAQAIMTGSLAADGSFAADELLLKCPTRYEDSIPNQTGS